MVTEKTHLIAEILAVLATFSPKFSCKCLLGLQRGLLLIWCAGFIIMKGKANIEILKEAFIGTGAI
jgi:hypothetical protein